MRIYKQGLADLNQELKPKMYAKSLILFLTATLALSTGDKVESATKESVVAAAKVVSQVSLGPNETKAPAIDLKAKTARETDAFLGRRRGRQSCGGDDSLGINDCNRVGLDRIRCDGVLDVDSAWVCDLNPSSCRCRGSDQCKCDKKPVDASGNRCIPCFYSLHLCVCYP